jgi:hypothetical protein
MNVITLLVAACLTSFGADAANVEQGGDRTMTKVIKLLQGMLEKSKEDGEKDVKIFAKYQCFCDTNDEDKVKSIADAGQSIEQLAGEIGVLQGENGKLSTELAELEMGIGDNERARTTAATLREKAKADFIGEEEDMVNAIGQMDQAIDTLAAIGADQTAAKASLASLKGTVKKTHLHKELSATLKVALHSASIFLPSKQQRALSSFLQAPFTGTYSSQSGEIVGILKNMRDTFKANLASARASESAAAESHTKFAKVKEDEHEKLTSTFEDKTKITSANDETLGAKKASKAELESSKADDEEFLGKLRKQCTEKKAQYEDRKMIRANEEAAVTQAISILNSDAAFDTFGKTKATSEGETGPALIQVSSHAQRRVNVRDNVAMKLKVAAKRLGSLKLAKVAVALEGGNPFNKVVAELDQMIAIIAKEEKEDVEQKEWCDSEREDNHAQLANKKSGQDQLNGEIVSLTDEIENEETGLKKQMADLQAKLDENHKEQADEIEDRGMENVAYQANVRNLVKAQEVVGKATKVLKKFYDWLHKKQGPHHYDKTAGKDSGIGNMKRIAGASIEQLEDACSEDPNCAGFNSKGWLKSEIAPEDEMYSAETDLYIKVYDVENPVLLQKKARKEDPDMPDSFEDEESDTGSYSGQTGKAGDVVSMLTFIVKETKKEEDSAHEDELAAQHSFEDTMTDLKTQEAATLDSMAEVQDLLAEKEKSLEETTIDHERVTHERKAVEKYLLKIKGGCDFITENFDTRNDNRAAETASLETAKEELYSTPAYKRAKAEEEKLALGECAEKCEGDREGAECMACVEGISVAGYCAANKGAKGCDDPRPE